MFLLALVVSNSLVTQADARLVSFQRSAHKCFELVKTVTKYCDTRGYRPGRCNSGYIFMCAAVKLVGVQGGCDGNNLDIH